MNMQNTYTQPTDKKARQGQEMLPSHINVSNLALFSTFKQSIVSTYRYILYSYNAYIQS